MVRDRDPKPSTGESHMTAHRPLDEAERRLFDVRGPRRTRSKQMERVYLYGSLLTIDIFIILAVPTLLSMFVTGFYGQSLVLATLPMALLYTIIAINSGTFSLETLKRPSECVRLGVTSLLLAEISLLVAIFFLKQSEETSRLSMGLSALSTIAVLGAAHLVFGMYVRRTTGGRLTDEVLLIDGVDPKLPFDGYTVVYTEQLGLKPVLSDPNMLHRFGMLAKTFDRMLIACVPERRAAWTLLLKGADIEGEMLMEEDDSLGALGLGSFFGRETLVVSRKPLDLASRVKKRALDLAVTIPLLVFLFPLLTIVAIIIKLEDGGPVLFKQDRVGRANCQFKVLKFRSMRVDSCDANGDRSTMRDDDRITRTGRFIRATSIDELPQLFNVLMGDMSLVGPRPHALGSLAGTRLFWEVDQTYWHRHQLKPGITGLAQIRGHRGATHNISDLKVRLQADMEYVQEWGIWRDISILFQTFRVIVHNKAF